MIIIFSILILFNQCFCSDKAEKTTDSQIAVEQANLPCQNTSAPVASENEALFLRRISEFYEEKEYNIVFAQGEEFLKLYPDSIYADELRILLGDLSLDREMYSQSLSYYTSIKSDENKEKVFFNVLECYYHRKDFEKIVESCRNILSSNKSLDKDQKEKIQNTYALSLFKWIQEDETRNYQINEAVSIFESLKGTQYDLVAKEHLAYLYTEKKAYNASTNLYLELAAKCPEKQQDYLFLAAEQARNFDTHLAIKTYGQVCYLGGDRAKDAAFNRLLLFFEEKKYGDILITKDQIAELVGEENKPLFHYYVARSFFEVENFAKAKEEFTLFLEKSEDKDLRISSNYYLIHCAQKLKDVSLLDEIVVHLEKEFKENKLYLEALFSRALLQKEKENFLSAEKDFSKIMESGREFTRKQEMLFEWAHMYLESKNYEKAHPLFQQYITSSKDVATLPLAWHYFIYCSIKNAENNPTNDQKLVLEKDLTNALKRSISVGEKAEYLYLLGKTRFQLKQFEQSIKSFDYLVKAFPKTKYLSKAYVYLGYSYREKNKDFLKFVECLEKALENPNSLSHLDTLHLGLYNAYYELSQIQKESKIAQKKVLEGKEAVVISLKPTENKSVKKEVKYPFNPIAKAAEHLYSLYTLNPDKVSFDNRLWLASYFHITAKRKKENKNYIERGIVLYKNTLKNFRNKALKDDQVYLESHFLRLAELYQLNGNKELEIEVLNDLKKKYEAAPNLGWEFQNKTYYYLASAIKEKDVAKAIDLFDKVGSSPYSKANLTNLSLLEGAKLKKLSYVDLAKDDPKYIDLVCRLKNLSLKRSIDTEPVHLEASLELIELMTDKTASSEEQTKRRIEQLAVMKKRFMSKDDILSKDYHTLKNSLPSKDKLFKAYMSYLDSEMLLLQSKLCEASEKKQLEKEANRLLKEIETEAKSYPFLRERLKSTKG